MIGLRRSIPAALFWPAAAAGVGFFLVCDAASWTGRHVCSLQLR